MRVEWKDLNSRIGTGDDETLRKTVSLEDRERVEHVIVLSYDVDTLPDVFVDLPNLKIVTIACRRVNDISVLIKYPLMILYIQSQVRDISSVSKMTSLKYLIIDQDNCDIPDLSELSRLEILTVNNGTPTLLCNIPPSVYSLKMEKLVIPDGEEIDVNHSITTLEVGNVRSLEFVRYFSSLTTLKVRLEAPVDMEILSSLYQLETLVVNCYCPYPNRIIIVPPAIPTLKSLTLNNGVLCDVTFLKGCQSLITLNMCGMSLPEDLTPIWGLKLIDLRLWLYTDRQLDGIVALKDTLRTLELDCHRTSLDISCISYLRGLTRLKLGRSCTTDISSIKNLPLQYVCIPCKISKGIHCLFSIERISLPELLTIDVYCNTVNTISIKFEEGTVMNGKQLQERLKGVDYIDESAGEFIKSG